MAIVNAVFGAFVGTLLWPFRGLSPWWGLLALSVLTALAILWVYKRLSDQEALRRAKDRIKAGLLEIRLYKDDLGVTLRAQGAIVKANLAYAAANLKPLLVAFAPLVFVMAQIGLWYDRAPLEPGQVALVKVATSTSAAAGAEWRIEASENLEVTSPAVRIPDEKQVCWRVKALAEGRGLLVFGVEGNEASKSVVVGGPRLAKVSRRASRGSLWNRIIHPGEPPLPAGPPIVSIEVLYPSRALELLGLRIPWLVAYLVLSVGAGLALKGFLGVEI